MSNDLPSKSVRLPGIEKINIDEEFNEEELLFTLSNSIASLLETQPDLLLSSLYRMDISESKVRKILDNKEAKDFPIQLAKLVLKRQKASLDSRKKFPQKKIDDPEASY